METDGNEEAMLAHNELANYLANQLLDTELKTLKFLFCDAPLTRRELQDIKEMPELFQVLRRENKIAVGDYVYFTERLRKVHLRLAKEVEKKEKDIQRLMNNGSR